MAQYNVCFTGISSWSILNNIVTCCKNGNWMFQSILLEGKNQGSPLMCSLCRYVPVFLTHSVSNEINCLLAIAIIV